MFRHFAAVVVRVDVIVVVDVIEVVVDDPDTASP